MNRYLVTGGSGFIGTNLVEYHLRRGDGVLNFDSSPPRDVEHAHVWRGGSLLDPEQLRQTFEDYRPTHIYHLAARTDLDGEALADYAANTTGLQNLIEICSQQPQLKRVIFASSRLVCRIGYEPKSYADYCPSTAYGESKVRGEQIVRALGPTHWSWAIVRPTSIWGPWFGIPYRNFFDALRRGRYLHPAKLDVWKSFGYVGNVVHELAALMRRDEVHGQTYYVGDYEPINVLEFAREVSKGFGARRPKEVPRLLLRLVAFGGDLIQMVGVRAPLTSFRLRNLMTPMLHDFRDLEAVVGDLPYGRGEAIQTTIAWMRQDEE